MRFLYALGVCAICAASCNDSSRYARIIATETQLRSFEIALGDFAKDCGRYPSSVEGLDALINQPSGISEAQWKGPYLDSSTISTDPWGHNYVYAFPNVHSTNRFDIYSCGPDGVSKTGGNDADDINNWTIRQRAER
jgi:general secretion pathway protein G